MAEKIDVVIHDRTAEASAQIFDIVKAVLTEVFEGPILAEAKALSPVGELPVRPDSKRNRDSIEVKVFGTKRGPFAKIFTTSGHGGYLEVGTSKMSSQPYIYPAVQKNIPRITAQIQEEILQVGNKADGKD